MREYAQTDTSKLNEVFHLKTMGGRTGMYLTNEQEEALALFLKQRTDLDASVHTLAIRQKAMQLARMERLPGLTWLRGFFERNPEVAPRNGT